MNFELIEISELSGDGCRIYSIIMDGDDETLFDQFLKNNHGKYPNEVQDIYDRLNVIGHEEGAREGYFKLNEGKPGDGVCALYDVPGSSLRLYCIRYGAVAIILGDGGVKPKTVRTWQQGGEIKKCAELMIDISSHISKAIKDKDIKITGKGLIGTLKIREDDE